jgi:hypothetical protein
MRSAWTGNDRHQPVAVIPSPMTRSTSAPAPVLSQYSSVSLRLAAPRAYLRRSRLVPTYSLVSSRVNLACASMTVEIHSTSLGLATCSW